MMIVLRTNLTIRILLDVVKKNYSSPNFERVLPCICRKISFYFFDKLKRDVLDKKYFWNDIAAITQLDEITYRVNFSSELTRVFGDYTVPYNNLVNYINYYYKKYSQIEAEMKSEQKRKKLVADINNLFNE